MEEELFHYGLTNLIEENYQTAIDYFSKSLEKNINYDAYLYRGCAYFKFGDYASAISDFNQAEQLKQNTFAVYYNRAQAHFYNQDNQSGLSDLTKAREFENLSQEQVKNLNSLSNKFS